MCGIAGILDNGRSGTGKLDEVVSGMACRLKHRGPDALGVWSDPEAGIALGHTRLAILDLSSQGSQPMHSMNGRFCIVFNGEIYSFKALRQELEQCGHRFSGSSDTRVMLEAISAWGLETALQRFNGMFAFALWDKKERVLHLARDRFGEKPLYYGWSRGVFFFASELKAIRSHPAFSAGISRTSLGLYLRSGYIPAPHTIYEGIYKLLPGRTLAIPNSRPRMTPQEYWSAADKAWAGTHHPFEGTYAEAAEELDALLYDSVAMRMESDVPLGAFLSGGIDSSIIVALMQAQSAKPIRTFTIGSPQTEIDEAPFAKAVALHLGTEHTELYVGPAEALNVVPVLPSLYDEPFSDASQIPTFLVSMLARRHVTVALSGDGGDELFGGYGRYFRARRVWNTFAPLKPTCLSAVNHLKEFGTASDSYSWGLTIRTGHMLDRIARLFAAESPGEMYDEFTAVWPDPSRVAFATGLFKKPVNPCFPDLLRTMLYMDTVTYLPEDILVKVDRASMGTSLESRLPLLDHRVFEFAWRLPMHMKVGRSKGKCILRKILFNYVPKKLVERPKRGFALPIAQWLRGPLKPWAEEYLSEERLRREGFLRSEVVRRYWQEHTSGRANWAERLWNILMFQAWLGAQ